MNGEFVFVDPRTVRVPDWARRIDRGYLEESVSSRGIISPIVVARVKGSRELVLVDGVGRLTVALEKGLDTVPARVIDVDSEDEAVFLAVELEEAREGWSLEYLASVVGELVRRGYGKREIAEKLRIPSSKLYRILNILSFPDDVKGFFFRGLLPIRFADSVAKALRIDEGAVLEALERSRSGFIPFGKPSEEEVAAKFRRLIEGFLRDHEEKKRVERIVGEFEEKVGEIAGKEKASKFSFEVISDITNEVIIKYDDFRVGS